jgi:hypothetical protein
MLILQHSRLHSAKLHSMCQSAGTAVQPAIAHAHPGHVARNTMMIVGPSQGPSDGLCISIDGVIQHAMVLFIMLSSKYSSTVRTLTEGSCCLDGTAARKKNGGFSLRVSTLLPHAFQTQTKLCVRCHILRGYLILLESVWHDRRRNWKP